VKGRNITMPNAQDHKKIRIIFKDGNMITQERFFKLKSARKNTGICLFICLFVFLALQPIEVVFSQPGSGL
jgi:type IV secretory pathway component VirB8